MKEAKVSITLHVNDIRTSMSTFASRISQRTLKALM